MSVFTKGGSNEPPFEHPRENMVKLYQVQCSNEPLWASARGNHGDTGQVRYPVAYNLAKRGGYSRYKVQHRERDGVWKIEKRRVIFMKKLKVYLDTSVISYLYQLDSPERMRDTLELWQLFKDGVYDVYISDIVLKEIGGCNEEKSK